MNFARTAIKAALCAAATLPCAGAWALTPTQVNALTAGNIVYVSGSTATDAAIKAWAKLNPAVDANAPFTAGSYDLYTTASGYVLTGTAGPVFGAISGTNVAIVKQTKGGSATGIHNVASAVAPGGFPDLSSLTTFTASCGAPTNTAASSPFQAFNTYACTLAESATIVPNAGISDEDPTTWIGTGGVTSGDATALAGQKPGVEVPFAIVVSTALRNQLQSQEGLTSGSELLADVPSLSSAQVRAILSGQMSSLADLFVFNPATNATGKIDTGATRSLVHICRRGDTSGSQFAANIRFFGKGCSKGSGVGAISAPDDGTTQASGEAWTGGANPNNFNQLGMFVFAGSGTGDVLKCVGAPLDVPANGDPAGTDLVNYRIGFVSTDQVPTLAGTWRYIALDGVAPTIWNIQLGLYDWLTEDAFNSTAASLALNGGPGNHAAIFNTIQANLSNVNGLAGLNAASRNGAALSDASGGGADTGIVTIGNAVLYGASDPTGPSAPAWPAAIRSIAVAGQGPNSPLAKTYPSQAENNCNGAYQSDPTG
jgi:hypothetical protein